MYKKNQTNSIAGSLQEVYFCQGLLIGSINYVLLTRDKVCHGVRVMFLLFFKYLIVKILGAFHSLFRNDFHNLLPNRLHYWNQNFTFKLKIEIFQHRLIRNNEC